jgi:hypothetical protein
MIVNSVNTVLSSIIPDFSGALQNEIWTALEREIRPQECSIYSYQPEPDSDPFAGSGTLYVYLPTQFIRTTQIVSESVRVRVSE